MIGTREAAALLGVRPNTLTRAVWEGRVPAPPKAPGGAYVWRDAELRRACWVIHGKTLDQWLAGREGAKGDRAVSGRGGPCP